MTKKYQSVTCWQGQDGYEIEVTFGEFDDVASAAKFGDWSAEKIKYLTVSKRLVLLTKEKMHLIDQRQLVVRRLKLSSMGKAIVDSSDFAEVEVKIESFGQIEGLSQGFELLGYGVVDWEGKPVDSSKYQREKGEIYCPIAEIEKNLLTTWGFMSERMDYE